MHVPAQNELRSPGQETGTVPIWKAALKSRKKIITALSAVVLFLSLLFLWRGYEATWHLWNIPTLSPHFADLRVITHGAGSHAQGFDPMIENPAAPTGTRLNYPRVWQFLYQFGLNEGHTTILGTVIILSFLVGICLVFPHVSNGTLAIVLGAVLSPAALLGAERGNIDLLMFFLAALSIVVVRRSPLLAAAGIFTGFFLKLFPIFGWAVLLKLPKGRFLQYSMVASAVVITYSVATLSDLRLISEATPRGTFLSYGMNVYWMALAETDPAQGTNAKVFAYFLVLAFLGFAVSGLFRAGPPQPAEENSLSLDSFRAGCAIYLGTFLLGNNWDYRLIFLIFTLPQLSEWSNKSSGISILAKVLLGAVLFSFWHMIIVKLLRSIPNGYQIGFVLDELANWTIFSCLSYLLCLSAPAWLKNISRTPLPITPQPV